MKVIIVVKSGNEFTPCSADSQVARKRCAERYLVADHLDTTVPRSDSIEICVRTVG